MKNIIWTEDAKNDLSKIILFYNERNGNTLYSKKLVDAVKKTLDLLKNHPFLGLKVKNLDNYRVLIIKNYKIFYKVFPENIEIVLVWDNRQNPEKISDKK